MTKSVVEEYMEQNAKKFAKADLESLTNMIAEVDEETFEKISHLHLASPGIATLFSVFLGFYGIDRFYIGDIGWGVIKLLTVGGFGILWLQDLRDIRAYAKMFNEIKIFNTIRPDSVKKPPIMPRLRDFKKTSTVVFKEIKSSVETFQDTFRF